MGEKSRYVYYEGGNEVEKYVCYYDMKNAKNYFTMKKF